MEVRSVEAIVRALNGAQVQYLIVSGLAVSAYGYVRLTRDVDIVIGLEPGNAAASLDALIKAGYRTVFPEAPAAFADPLIRERWRLEMNMIVLKLWSDEHHRTPVDVFIYERFDFAAEFARAPRLEICAGLEAPVVTLETLLQMKRDANRPQDRLDIEELLRAR